MDDSAQEADHRPVECVGSIDGLDAARDGVFHALRRRLSDLAKGPRR